MVSAIVVISSLALVHVGVSIVGAADEVISEKVVSTGVVDDDEAVRESDSPVNE